ncbi:hypothetical protein [Dyella monticola]|uniref:hypothetical protein n=1 Tax=Dyella monticola TaxID=1927958 RepID=UPI0011C05943|nr:hypothetical protein [Dyella monticola]
MSLILQKDKTNLMLVIKNSSDHNVKVSHLFSISSLIGPIRFRVEHNGSVLDLRAEGSTEAPNEGLYITLYPYQMVGAEYDISFIKALYGMTIGCYAISASYDDGVASQFNAYDKKITSNSMTLCFKEGGKSSSKPKP